MFRRVAVVEESDTFAGVVGIEAFYGELMPTVESKWAMLQGAYYNFINERVFLVASFAATATATATLSLACTPCVLDYLRH